MSTHSSILAWRIPWTEEPGGLQSMGSQRIRHDWQVTISLLQRMYIYPKFPIYPFPTSPSVTMFVFCICDSIFISYIGSFVQFFLDSTYKWYHMIYIRLDQSLSRVRLFVTPWITACQASLSITNSQSSLRLTSIQSVMPSSHLILCRPLLLLPPISPSIRVFSNESTLCMRWPKYWSFSFSIIPSKEIPGLIFRMDWLDLLAVQGTLKSFLQPHSSKASILRHSAFFTVQLSHPYMTTGSLCYLSLLFFGTLHSSSAFCFSFAFHFSFFPSYL